MASSEHPYVDPDYRVAIFGSARVQEHDPEVAEVYRLARGTVLPWGFFGAADLNNLFQVATPEEAVALIARVQADRSRMEHVCSNYHRYRTEFEFRGG